MRTRVKKIRNRPGPLGIELKGLQGPLRLLEEGVTTIALRSGVVSLKPKASVGRHTTGPKEEVVVLLSGIARITCCGAPSMTLRAPSLAYFPPHAFHDVTNCGKGYLRYVYIVHRPRGC